MKLFSKMIMFAMTFTMAMSFSSFAKEIVWETTSGSERNSILLLENETVSEDCYQNIARGEFLSMAALDITNLQNGQLLINIDTYAHHAVDEIITHYF